MTATGSRWTLEAGTTYRIDLKGLLIPAERHACSTPSCTGSMTRTANLIPGTLNDDGGQGTDSRVEFTPDADGHVLHIGRRPVTSVESTIGTYTLSVTGN